MATTNIKRSTSASRLINYAEKRAVQKDGHNIQIDYANVDSILLYDKNLYQYLKIENNFLFF